MVSDLNKLQARALYGLLSGIVVGGVGWCSWVSVTLQDVPSRSEVKEIVRAEAPYIETIANNTAAIRALEKQVAVQTSTTEGLLQRFKVLPEDVLEEVKALRADIEDLKDQ